MAFRVLFAGLLAIVPPLTSAETFFYLVRQWPTTYCSVEAQCTTDPARNAFSIHGLWPNYDRGGYPENCTNVRYDPSTVSSIRSEMTAAWESYSEPNDRFWAHEWECHGTCTKLEQADFFRTVLELNQKYNLEEALQSAGIVPDNDASYSTKDMSDAIKEAYGVDPTIRCANRRLRGEQLLDSVFMCFNENLQPEDCEDACPSGACEKPNCRTAVYPPFDTLEGKSLPDTEPEEALFSFRRRGPECKRGDHGAPGASHVSAT